jgi:hypothetical protein
MNLAYHNAKYVDLYEETMYNALLGGTDLEGKNFFYTNPLDAVDVRTPWHACPCCVGNIARTLLMMPTWVYAKSPDGVYVNLFVGSTITVENVGGADVQMVQATEYPWSGKVAITVNPSARKNFSVRIRVPNRAVSSLYKSAPDANGITSLSVNGAAVKPVIENGYAVITRAWKPGDKIDLVLPMKVQRVRASDKIEADRGRVALRYGPLMYNIESVDQDIAKSLSPDAPLTTEWKPDLLGGVMVIKGAFSDGTPLMAIPNFARTNRGPVPPPPPEPVAGTRPAPRAHLHRLDQGSVAHALMRAASRLISTHGEPWMRPRCVLAAAGVLVGQAIRLYSPRSLPPRRRRPPQPAGATSHVIRIRVIRR